MKDIMKGNELSSEINASSYIQHKLYLKKRMLFYEGGRSWTKSCVSQTPYLAFRLQMFKSERKNWKYVCKKTTTGKRLAMPKNNEA